MTPTPQEAGKEELKTAKRSAPLCRFGVRERRVKALERITPLGLR